MTLLKNFNHPLAPQIRQAVAYIQKCQGDDGAIPWYTNAKLDPWDHIEAAMALSIAGEPRAFINALQWLQKQQNSDGSWWANYNVNTLENITSDADDASKIETNFVAYPATGLWHHYRIYKAEDTLLQFYPMIRSAIDFVVAQQHPEGDIQWALSQQKALPKDALVTACSSILRSLECALLIAATLGDPQPLWHQAYVQLHNALRNKPWRFDRTWESKSRFSMDWFYPILAGIYSPEEARRRLETRWNDFVRKDLGCRCVDDEPWVTVAESCELVLACLSAGQFQKAHSLFQCLSQWQDNDGGFWTGYSYRDKVIWPHEKTSWTAAAYVLAADALFSITPAANLLTQASTIVSHDAATPPMTPPAL
ncbi:hypothetical protein P886_1872 [Alteromonadaceae bacterium 2753L.S.0a.02]|nr:hypothetical protein P886_1872 [Alteromonadaceae bacterium 2753L.S.0a.02]